MKKSVRKSGVVYNFFYKFKTTNPPWVSVVVCPTVHNESFEECMHPTNDDKLRMRSEWYNVGDPWTPYFIFLNKMQLFLVQLSFHESLRITCGYVHNGAIPSDYRIKQNVSYLGIETLIIPFYILKSVNYQFTCYKWLESVIRLAFLDAAFAKHKHNRDLFKTFAR